MFQNWSRKNEYFLWNIPETHSQPRTENLLPIHNGNNTLILSFKTIMRALSSPLGIGNNVLNSWLSCSMSYSDLYTGSRTDNSWTPNASSGFKLIIIIILDCSSYSRYNSSSSSCSSSSSSSSPNKSQSGRNPIQTHLISSQPVTIKITFQSPKIVKYSNLFRKGQPA